MLCIEHLGMYTDNLERAAAFYREFFGARSGNLYHNPKTRFSSYFLEFGGGARLELMHSPSMFEGASTGMPTPRESQAPSHAATSREWQGPSHAATSREPQAPSHAATSRESQAPSHAATPRESQAPSPALGRSHLAFCVGNVDAVVRLTERLRRAGYEIYGEPRWTGDGYFESVVGDPDGNRLELCADERRLP
ncbi:MAG: VOC family protein [Polyangiaceae bacterium]